MTWRPKETVVEDELREVVRAKFCLSSLKKIIFSFKAPNLPILNIRHPSWVKCQMKIYLFILLSNDSGSFIITLHSNKNTTKISPISSKGFFQYHVCVGPFYIKSPWKRDTVTKIGELSFLKIKKKKNREPSRSQ